MASGSTDFRLWTVQVDEYRELTTPQKGVYDVLGQRGFDHDACMVAVREWIDTVQHFDPATGAHI